MKLLRNLAVLLACLIFAAWAADRMAVYNAQLSGPMGTDSGRVILAGDQLVFFEDVNPDLTFSIPKSEIRSLRWANGVLTLNAAQAFTYGEGSRADASIRLTDPAMSNAIATWVGVPLEGAVVTSPNTITTTTVVQPVTQMVFPVKHEGDRGKLIMGPTSIEFQSYNHPNKSRSWTYSQIKEIKRDHGERKIEIYPSHGDKYEFKTNGPEITEGIYNILFAHMR